MRITKIYVYMQVPFNNTFNLRMLNLALKFKSAYIGYRSQVFTINNFYTKVLASHYIKHVLFALCLYVSQTAGPNWLQFFLKKQRNPYGYPGPLGVT